MSVSDTIQGGAVSLPRVIRQVEGPDLLEPGMPPGASCETGAAERVGRVAAGSPVALSVALAGACFGAADTAVLARDDVFADALAAAGLAGEVDAPVLLTPTAGLDPAVAEELERLGVERAVLAGGTAALSEQVEADLDTLGVDVERIGGAERFSTAALIADAVVAAGGPVERATVALGSRPDGGDAWPDALASGVLAATDRVPVLLAQPDAATAPTIAALGRLLQPGAEVLVAGGPAAVGDAVLTELTAAGYAPRRLSGADRYGTATAIADEARAAGADLDVVLLASGEEFAAALVAGPAAVHAGGVMVLAHPQTLASGPATADFLAEHAAEVGRVLLVGDSAAISDTVLAEVAAALEEQAPAEDGG